MHRVEDKKEKAILPPSLFPLQASPSLHASPLDPLKDIRILNGDSHLRFAVIFCPGMGEGQLEKCMGVVVMKYLAKEKNTHCFPGHGH